MGVCVMKNLEVDFVKCVHPEDGEIAMDNIKGVIVLLQGLEFADEAGTHKYQKHSYQALITALDSSIKNIEELNKGIAYMDNIIREGSK